MKTFILILLALLPANIVFAGGSRIGIVVSVEKDRFTVKPEIGADKTMTFGPDMGKRHNNFHPEGTPLGVTPDKIKKGMIVYAAYENERGIFVCTMAMIIEEHLGIREIDFSPMLAKDKDTLPKFRLRLQLYSRGGLGNCRPWPREFTFKEGASLKDVMKDVKFRLRAEDWKFKEEGDAKLLIESRMMKREEPLNQVIVVAEGLPKDRQPRVRFVNPRDPTK